MQIMAAILRTCDCTDGVNKTRIVYQANLNFRTVNPYLSFLIEKGLIEVRHDGRLYKISDTGVNMLEKFKNIEHNLGIIYGRT